MPVLNLLEEEKNELIRLENIIYTLRDKFRHNPDALYKAVAYIIAKKVVKTSKDFEKLQDIIG